MRGDAWFDFAHQASCFGHPARNTSAAASFLFVDGLQLIIGHGLNGLADMKIPALIAGLAYWGIGLCAGVVFAFAMDLGVRGIWWGLILGVSVAAVAYSIRFRWVVRRVGT
uniref:MatE protein n=1 Tax=Candidatus Kentrum sp. DK TaxID=2126562 RepID=A0A450SKU8_9GAMM|nr:MAG: hypothetical protein BECKDK2373B_GA0170837_104531 [Candidatus Kentron sp. DK]